VYDPARNYTHFSDAESGLHEWHYDGNNRVWKMTLGTLKVYEVAYTPGGLVDTTTLFDAAGAAIAKTTHSYDGLGRKVRAQTVRLSAGGVAGEVVADFGWKYDTLDLVERIEYHHLGVETVLGYNKRRELVSEDLTSNGAGAPPPWPDPTLGPPATGMLSDWSGAAKAVTSGPMAIAARHAEYAFDPAGNRIRQKIGTTEVFYKYNAASQLTDECPGSPTATPRVVHQYDPSFTV
jgi:hypothetical protein